MWNKKNKLVPHKRSCTMEKNIADLLHERELISSQLEKIIYGSIEIRNNNGKEYIYVHKRIEEFTK